MEVVLIALDVLQFHAEAKAIREKWDDLLSKTGCKPTHDYRKACPRAILELAAKRAFDGTTNIGARITQKGTTGRRPRENIVLPGD
jgi:hypothetical protein